MKSLLPNSRKYDISVYPSGKIEISAHVAHRLSLFPGDVIDFVKDQDEIFLRVKLRAGSCVGRHEGRVWSTAHGKGTFRAWSKALAKVLLAAAGVSGPLRCPCGSPLQHNDSTFIPVIYRCSL